MTALKQRPKLSEQALWGLGGEITKQICRKAESDPAGVLLQLYTLAGCYIGRKVFVEQEANKIYANIFTLLVGKTATGRKGTSYGLAKKVFEPHFSEFLKENVKTGLASGQGLAYHLRDKTSEDAGVEDKRLCIKESEFVNCLNVSKIDSSTLSGTIREAFDSNTLASLAKNSSFTATDPHVSIIAHITPSELYKKLTLTDVGNGFANRFLFTHVERTQVLPSLNGFADRIDYNNLSQEVFDSLSNIKANGQMKFSDDCEALWARLYPVLSDGVHGTVGDLTARSSTHILKLSLIIAILNQEPLISLNSLKTAIHIVQYCLDSINYLFENSLGRDELDTVYLSIKESDSGLTKTQISELFDKNKRAPALAQITRELEQLGLIYSEKIQTKGAPQTVYKLQAQGANLTKLTEKGGALFR